MPEKTYIAVVEKIITGGKHGPYAVTSQELFGTITFALTSTVWKETYTPEPGEFVVLTDLRKKREGWRAMTARRFKTSDEAQSKEQTPMMMESTMHRELVTVRDILEKRDREVLQLKQHIAQLDAEIISLNEEIERRKKLDEADALARVVKRVIDQYPKS